jgi:hypothetical protein
MATRYGWSADAPVIEVTDTTITAEMADGDYIMEPTGTHAEKITVTVTFLPENMPPITTDNVLLVRTIIAQ